jgi:hypothetical protein
MTYDDRDRDMRDETSPGEGDVREDLDTRRPTDLDDEVEDADDRGQKIDGETEEDDVARRDDPPTNR